MMDAAGLAAGVVFVFWALAKTNARPGFNAFALGLFIAATPFFSRFLPLHPGIGRDVGTVFLFLVAASLGTALGGGLKDREDGHDHEHSHDHNLPHAH